MAHMLLPPRSFQKRKSIRDSIEGIDTLDDESKLRERYELMDELDDDLEQSADFRWHAPATQSRQDFHLSLYRTFVLKWLKGYEDDALEQMDDDQQMLICFTNDEKRLGYQLNMFIIHVFKRSAPRSRAANTILVRSLVKYRDSMLFWTEWFYNQREKVWSRKRLYNDMTKAMRYVQKKYGDRPGTKAKTWLGLPELRQLLDFEAMNNRCIELSEEHQVLWCIGRVTALRPGSLCPSGKYGRTEPLTWRDLEITCGDEPGKFNVRLTVDRLDIKHPEDPVQDQAASQEKFTMKMDSPQARNLIFSPAHRLLVISLRRGVLQGISSIDELLNYSGYVIPIAPEHLDDVIFLAGRPKGDAIDLEKPLVAHALTEYLQRRGKQIGYNMRITWYSIRRRAATDMAARIGLEATRLFLGHSPDSQVLELYYLNLTETLDSTGVLLEQAISTTGRSDQMRLNWAPLALNRLENVSLQRLRGNALAQMTRRLILADPDPPKDLSARALKNYRRNARRVAEEHLTQVEAEKQRTTLSKADMDKRQAGLRASQFADEVLQRALEAAEENGIGSSFTGQADASLEDAQDEDGSLFIGAETADAEEAPEPEPEDDIERTMANFSKELERDADGAIITSVDHDDHELDMEDAPRAQVQEASYKMQAKVMMELLMDNTFPNTPPGPKWTRLALFARMMTPSASNSGFQAKEHKLKAHLDSHLNGNFHHPVSKWKRKAEFECKNEDGRFACPYCEGAGAPDVPAYKRLQDLILHIMDSSQISTGRKHDELKAADGWYDDDFQYAHNLPPSMESVAKHMARGAKNLAAAGIDTTPRRQLLQPEPYERSKSIVRGSHPEAPLPARIAPYVQSGPPTLPTAEHAIPPHLVDYVGTGYMKAPNPLPAYMKDVVNVTRFPRSQEDEDEDEEMTG
ncbi:hypothetical protein LTR36_002420 [Oleoguttula mirabilis]|uniref:Tyr recombinase domain-containing protein n=1 Tax=Oleoguttula mirabilis TaxID=1507867 RepID=A0AAV9JKT7_9PEZI|nr:hypothetical protein LTR36_002420 [Oleoguttula mirabilis]